MTDTKEKGLNVSVKSFITAIVVIFVLMVATYVLTLFVQGGEYARITDENGNVILDTVSGYHQVEGGIPFWKWILSPFLVLGASGNGALIAVIAFLLVIGGVFSSLDHCGLIKYMLNKLTHRFGAKKYRLMAVLTFFFMALGSLVGSFEECVPLVPIVVALAVKLGWDPLTGLGMSLLAVGCGFAAGVCNPFTVGVAQQLANLPMFSGIWLRLVAFVLIYALLLGFVYLHAKKVEKKSVDQENAEVFVADKKLDCSLMCFASIFGVGIVAILSSAFIDALQDYTMVIVAVTFLAAGITATLVAGMDGKTLGKTAWQGVTSIFPAVIMILMAASIKYTMEEAKILDTILHGAVSLADSMQTWTVVLFIYLIVLVMNFFIASGSAKAFMLIPLLQPMAQIFGVPMQLCIVAFAFGDGFSNVFYPTNAALLISLGLADVSYGQWVKYSWKFQIMNLLLTSLILLFGLAVGYC